MRYTIQKIESIRDVVLSRGRPQLPLSLDLKLRTLIELCWHDDPEERPNFLEICKVLVGVKGEHCLKMCEFKY